MKNFSKASTQSGLMLDRWVCIDGVDEDLVHAMVG